MYRLTIHQTGPGTVRVTHKPTGFTYEHHVPTQRHLVLALRDDLTDLASYHGRQLNVAAAKRSIISAVRRMR